MSEKWTEEEDQTLIQHRQYLNSSYRDIAELLPNRTRNSVRHRWEKLASNQEALSKTPAKILVFDIETSPLKVYSWGVYTQFLRPENIIQDWFVLSWAAKWLYDDEIMSDVLTPKEALAAKDKRIVAKLWKLFDVADIIVAHNGDKFDKKKMNWRFLYHGFAPPMSYKTVDTLKVARRCFAASSNKLDYLTQQLDIGKKYETGGFKLWKDCMDGDQDALLKMLAYNIKDIQILEDTYLALLPWITNHPNLGLYTAGNQSVCPACGSANLDVSDKVINTAANSYYQYRCLDCQHVGRTKETSVDKKKRKSLMSN